MLCDLGSLKDLDIRGKEVGDLHKRGFFMIKLNGIVLEEVIHVPIHGWQGSTERQKVAGDAINGLLQMFESPSIIINGTFSIYILQLLAIVSENTGLLALYFFTIMGITIIDEQAVVSFKVSLV